MLYEFPGFGESKSNYYFNILHYCKKDIVKELQEKDYDYVIGYSMGGNILLRALARRESNAQLILLSPEYSGIDLLKP